ncbi:MAG: hypothetical protein D6717_06845 [Gammaproteobacteria bacterium]|nr:MAG: hypothetical protein D6717_06845 [Gammaproteobacteria bacterium]
MSAVAPIHGHQARRTQNGHMLVEMANARACLEALVRDGFTVLRVEIGSAQPVVWIQGCPRCSRLDGAWYRIEGGPRGRVYTWQASCCGCRVQWESREDPGC